MASVNLSQHLTELQAEISQAAIALSEKRPVLLSDFFTVYHRLEKALVLTAEIAGEILPRHNEEVVALLHVGTEVTRDEVLQAISDLIDLIDKDMPATVAANDDLDEEEDDALNDDDLSPDCANCEYHGECDLPQKVA